MCPAVYTLFVPGHTLHPDFVVHTVLKKSHVVYRQEMNSMEISFTIINKLQSISIYFLLIYITKGCKSNINLTLILTHLYTYTVRSRYKQVIDSLTCILLMDFWRKNILEVIVSLGSRKDSCRCYSFHKIKYERLCNPDKILWRTLGNMWVLDLI